MKYIQRFFAIVATVCVIASIGVAGSIERGASLSENAPTAFCLMGAGLATGSMANKIGGDQN